MILFPKVSQKQTKILVIWTGRLTLIFHEACWLDTGQAPFRQSNHWMLWGLAEYQSICCRRYLWSYVNMNRRTDLNQLNKRYLQSLVHLRRCYPMHVDWFSCWMTFWTLKDRWLASLPTQKATVSFNKSNFFQASADFFIVLFKFRAVGDRRCCGCLRNPAKHLGWCKNLVNIGRFQLPTLTGEFTGFQPSTVSWELKGTQWWLIQPDSTNKPQHHGGAVSLQGATFLWETKTSHT